MKIYLIGFMGAGKSQIGKRLANALGLSFLDLDEAIEEGEKMQIDELFQRFGESHFRKIESQYLRSLPDDKVAIVATGGGTPCFHNNLEFMNLNGVTIYLKVTVKTLVDRLNHEKDHRPLLKVTTLESLEKLIADKLKEREFWYEEAQFVCIAEDGIDEIVLSLKSYFKRFVPIVK